MYKIDFKYKSKSVSGGGWFDETDFKLYDAELASDLEDKIRKHMKDSTNSYNKWFEVTSITKI